MLFLNRVVTFSPIKGPAPDVYLDTRNNKK